ncbi:zinc finger protein 502 [Drosophila biarmipes]|uniref:zinc finger protein 502 n=1 Tax=Drosophila biarmipes TaxID=125945 RepID=UPI0007E80B73|nr:zinc finger protein 502 [Drosophila biarmipes]
MRETCRACRRRSGNLSNIFESRKDRGISIAHIISEVTGLELEKGDALPGFICPPCLADAQNAFDIIKTYERSYGIFCEARDAVLEDDPAEEDVCLIADSDSEILLCDEEALEVNGQVKRAKAAVEDSPLQIGVNVAPEGNIKANGTKEPYCTVELVKEDGKEVTNQAGSKIKNGYFTRNGIAHERKNKCPYCGKFVSSVSNLEAHIRVHTGERPFKCSRCPKAFKDTHSLRKHAMTHTADRPFKCSLCPKSFRDRTHLNRHHTMHTGERPHACNLCSKSFLERFSLKRHARTHTGERPHKCPICQTTFAELSNLKQHSRIHTGERPFTCDHCDRAFTNKSDCRKHAWTHSKKKPFQCSDCPRSFSQLNRLRTHTAGVHTKKSDDAIES